MVEDIKSRGDRILRSLLAAVNMVGQEQDEETRQELEKDPSGLGKEIITTLLMRAGRGKDEMIQILGREIGLALAAVLKNPLKQLVENQTLRITVELQPKPTRKGAKNSPRKGKSAKNR